MTGRRVWVPPAPRPLVVTVGPREAEVLTGICQGMTNAQIGRRMSVTEDTVKTHARRLFRKFGALDRAHVAALASSGHVEVIVQAPGPR